MIEIIPAIDIIDGKCVRLEQGNFSSSKIYREHPVETARKFEAEGFRSLHLVDLDGARSGSVKNLRILEQIAAATSLAIDFSGGIKTKEDLESVWNAGAAKVSIGSLAVRCPELFYNWLKQYGAGKIWLGADVRDEKIVVQGWQQQTMLSIYTLVAEYALRGGTTFFCTDTSKDGTMQGPATALYRALKQRFPGMEIIASGGVASMEDIGQLEAAGCSAVIVGKAIYEGRVKLADLNKRKV